MNRMMVWRRSEYQHGAVEINVQHMKIPVLRYREYIAQPWQITTETNYVLMWTCTFLLAEKKNE